MVSQEEVRTWKQRYDKEAEIYRRVSEYIMDQCLEEKKRSPKAIRVVFSREPRIKTFNSLVDKIDDKRKTEDPSFTYDELPDIIALTVLCAYRTDVRDFIGWLKKSFNVLTPDSESLHDNPKGHRGYHYIVTVRDDVLRSHPDYRDIKCEIQIKTLLEEAFDAKTHDLTYKPGSRKVNPKLKDQFAFSVGR